MSYLLINFHARQRQREFFYPLVHTSNGHAVWSRSFFRVSHVRVGDPALFHHFPSASAGNWNWSRAAELLVLHDSAIEYRGCRWKFNLFCATALAHECICYKPSNASCFFPIRPHLPFLCKFLGFCVCTKKSNRQMGILESADGVCRSCGLLLCLVLPLQEAPRKRGLWDCDLYFPRPHQNFTFSLCRDTASDRVIGGSC